MWVRSPGREDSLKEEVTTHSSILAWAILWTDEPGGLRFMGVAKCQTQLSTHTHADVCLSQAHPFTLRRTLRVLRDSGHRFADSWRAEK